MRIHKEDIITMALLYRKKYAGTEMISYEKVEEYERIVNDNLDEMNSNYGNKPFAIFKDCRIYTILLDENGKLFAVIGPDNDLMEAKRLMNYLPLDLVISSTRDNALSAIGLTCKKEKVKIK